MRSLTDAPSPMTAPHTCDVAVVADALGVDPARGLDPAEVERRRAVHGPNELVAAPGRGPWRIFADQFRSTLIVILVVAAGVAAAVGDVKDPIVIGVVIVLNAVLGFLQEHRAERSVEALRRMTTATVRVRRGGTVGEVDSTELVPGDVVLLEAGDRVPADGRLSVAVAAAVDESALTGESVPVEKHTAAIPEPDRPLAERTNSAAMATALTRGRAELVVTATGMATEIGRVAGALQAATPVPTPLQRQLAQLGGRLGMVALVAVALVFGVALLQGDPLSQALLDAVALAVAAIPEGLPAVVTVTLAVGTLGMARRNAIVKRLASVETLGCTSVICSDKTGTLTRNQMAVRLLRVAGADVVAGGDGVSGAGAAGPVRAALVTAAGCNDAAVGAEGAVVGEPTEAALARWASANGVTAADAGPRVAELPFDPATKLMATVHRRHDGGVVCHVKGGGDVVALRCTTAATPDGPVPVDLAATLADVDELAGRGLRVLALASRRLTDGEVAALDAGTLDPAAVADHGLHLEGLVGIVDPPRPEAAVAVARCARAGVAVKMITGDHAVTAGAIAVELGIPGEVVTGAELDRMDDATLARRAEGIGVFARVAPDHKVRIVAALQGRGHVVAMTGDGVNDAAALKRADIGVAMGLTGTDVTKEAADLILADDDVATIVAAVEGGRTIYANIVTFVRFQLATNIGAITTILVARLLGLPVPFTPIQILWVNLIMDGPPAMALGVDPPRPNTMAEPPRDPRASILTWPRLRRLAVSGAVMAAGTLAVFQYGRESLGGEPGAVLGTTLAFTTFVLFQFFNTLNARAEHHSALGRHSLTNGRLWAALGVVAALQVAAVHLSPLQRIVDTTSLSATQWALCAAVASTVLWVEEGRKLVHRVVARRRRPVG